MHVAMVLAVVVAGLGLGGCVGSPVMPEVRTWEFTLVVGASSDSTIELYTMNDGSMARAVAIPFQAPGDDVVRVPSPEIRVYEGDTVILTVQNLNPLPHTLHLHGGLVPWREDGVDYLTQFPIQQGEEYTYTFRDIKAGSYWYHCHMDGAHHIDLGMYGAFIVMERKPQYEADRDYVVLLDEYDNCHVHGNTDPLTNQEPTPDTAATSDCYYRFLLDNLAQNRLLQSTGQTVNSTVPDEARDTYCPLMRQALADVPEPARSNALLAAGCLEAHAHGTPPPQQSPKTWWYETNPVYNPLYNTFLVNGKAFPDSPVFPVREGEMVRFRIINAGNQMHSWHPHGHTMLVTHKDGYALPFPYKADTLVVGPGERYDYIMRMNNPGLWMIHDQNGLAMTNDNVHPGGMMACFAYDGFEGVRAFALTRALDCHTEGVRILGEGGHGH